MEQTVEGDLGYRLKLSGGVPKYPIVNKPFDVEISVVDEIDQTRYHNVEVPITFRAVWEGSLELCPPGLVEVSPSSLFIKTNGTAVASISIREVSALHDNNRILIIFEEKVSETRSDSEPIAPTSTPALCCVRHKLTVEDWDEKDRLMTSPYVWYKDEGGKDKCIELKICLTDDCDKKVHNRVVPLKATLMYECGQEVQQQNILVINLHDSKVSIDETGEGVIKLRINEVSNRHRSQRFQIMVSAEHQPDCSDISPAFSTPVDVKSKRNNRPRDGDNPDLSEPNHKRLSLGQKSAGSVGSFDSHYGNTMTSLSTAPSGVGIGPNMGADSHNLMQNQTQYHGVSQVKRVKQTKAQTQALSQSVVTNMSANLSNFNGGNQNQPSNNQYASRGSNTASTSSSGGSVGVGGENLSCAVDHVIRWATTVMTAVEKIQWRPLGFAQNLDGSHDFSRCLSSIPDPTLHIVEIVKQYECTVMPSLHFLLAAAKEGDKDALLGLQGPVGGNGGGSGGGGYSQGQLHTRHRSSIDDLGYEDSLRSGSNSNTSSNNTSTKNNNNNNNNVEGIVNSSMCANTLEGHQGMQSKNNASDWLMSGGDTFRSVGSTATTDADIFSYQLPVKPPISRQSSTGNEGAYLDDGRQGLRNEKNVSSVHSNGSSNGAALSLTQPSMLRENTLNRDTSFTFGSTPSVSETPGQVEMPQLSRNHSLFGYLEVPSMTRNQSLSRAYDDPFGASPRGGNTFGSSSRGSGITATAAPFMSLFSGANDLYQFNAQPTSSTKAMSGVLKDGEHLVHYILAKPLHTDVGSMGIPAFDQGKVLIGLYREGQAIDKSTILDYLPLSALMSVLTEADCTRAKDSLEEAISEKNRSVHVLGSNSSKWKNSLEIMKEDAMIFSLAGEAEEEEKQHNHRKSLSRASAGQGSYDKLLDEKEGKSSLLGGCVEGL